MPKGNDILECSFLDRRLNKIIILVAASLVIVSIVVIGIVNNMGLENAKGNVYARSGFAKELMTQYLKIFRPVFKDWFGYKSQESWL